MGWRRYSVWTFGLPFGETAANGDVLLAYYAPPAADDLAQSGGTHARTHTPVLD